MIFLKIIASFFCLASCALVFGTLAVFFVNIGVNANIRQSYQDRKESFVRFFSFLRTSLKDPIKALIKVLGVVLYFISFLGGIVSFLSLLTQIWR